MAGRSAGGAARGVLAILVVVTGTVAAIAPGSASAQTPTLLPARLVGDLHAAFGEHHARAVHAKGVVLTGRFLPDPAAAQVSVANVFARETTMVVRFSNFTGLPDIPDNSADANPRGLAIKLIQPDGLTYDIVAHSFNGFPVATAAEFGLLLRALAASGPTAAKPTALDAFLATHPAAKTFLATQTTPASWATATYYGVNAVSFTNARGVTRHIRYRFVPAAGVQSLDEQARTRRGPDYLADDIRARVKSSPVRFAWYAQIAGPGDRIDDPSVAWPETRRLVRLGTLVIDKLGANSAAEDRALLFLPGNLPPGIGVADPMLTIRNAAYPVSFSERQ